MASFIKAFNKLIKAEGGYVNDPDDNGGETFMGITRKNHPNCKMWIVIDEYKKKYSSTYGINKYLTNNDEVMEEIERFNAVAKELAKEGIVTSFHNHDAEFLTFYKGKCAFDYMVENSEYLKFELDCGWATYGHADPLKVLDKLGDKLCAIHIKDYTYGNAVQTLVRPGRPAPDENLAQNRMPRFTAPGTGELNLRGCLEKALAMGMDYAIVEQDFMYNLTQHETLTAAYLNMKETGFVE